MKDRRSQVATITPQFRDGKVEYHFALVASPESASFWVDPGIYKTLEEVSRALRDSIRPEWRKRILDTLESGQEITFDLKDAIEIL